MHKKLKLEKKLGNIWQLQCGKLMLVEFSVLDQIEAVRFAENWLSSFPSLVPDMEIPDECKISSNSEEARVPPLRD
jgi:hypothetical protein